jgi:hypothetical protein
MSRRSSDIAREMVGIPREEAAVILPAAENVLAVNIAAFNLRSKKQIGLGIIAAGGLYARYLSKYYQSKASDIDTDLIQPLLITIREKLEMLIEMQVPEDLEKQYKVYFKGVKKNLEKFIIDNDKKNFKKHIFDHREGDLIQQLEQVKKDANFINETRGVSPKELANGNNRFLNSIGNIFPNVQQLVGVIVSGVTHQLANNLKHGITGNMLAHVNVEEVGYGKGGEQLSIDATRNLTDIIKVITGANVNLTKAVNLSNASLSSGDFWIVITLILIGLFGLLWFIEDLIQKGRSLLAFKSNKKLSKNKRSLKKSVKKSDKKAVKKSLKKSVKKSDKKAVKKSAK